MKSKHVVLISGMKKDPQQQGGVLQQHRLSLNSVFANIQFWREVFSW